jgi:hypothetical protein
MTSRKDNDNRTPLLCAAERAYEELLVERDDVDVYAASKNEDGCMQLSWARGHEANMKQLEVGS